MSDEHKSLAANPIRFQFGGILKGEGMKVFGEDIWKDNVFHNLGNLGAAGICYGVCSLEVSSGEDFGYIYLLGRG